MTGKGLNCPANVIFCRAIREVVLDSRRRNLTVTVELLKGHL
jgi:hypothetical protein